jgi:hypothetical protein
MSNPWKLSMWRDALFNEVNAIETFLGNKAQLAEVLASDGRKRRRKTCFANCLLINPFIAVAFVPGLRRDFIAVA